MRADEVVCCMREAEAPMILGHVVSAIFDATGGDLGAMEIGFFSRLSLHAVAGNAVFENRDMEQAINAPLRLVVDNSACVA